MKNARTDLEMPAEPAVRDAIRRRVQAYCARRTLVPPLTLAEIAAHADRILHAAIEPRYRGLVTVLVGNEVWRGALAATPFARRILLLPQCLRLRAACRAKTDALGLLCEDCGRCAISEIQRAAEELGYVVLVAEGATAVAALLARGDADAVVGVGCLSALERSFRPLTTHAVPGLAVPLLRDGCTDTDVDRAWVSDVLRIRDDTHAYHRLDMHALRREVAAWFAPDRLQALLNASGDATATLAADWLEQAGHRWRPLLTAGVERALRGGTGPFSGTLMHVAVAVECFHKASLVHDDIEDDDDTRAGVQTLHRRHGLPVALNAGDLLIGEGYRLIAASGASAGRVREMVAVAAAGHRTLCLGQGAELLLRQQDAAAISSKAVLDIFRCKTAPAFEVALQLGAICAGANRATRAVLTAFSASLGIAYQIRDDLDDHAADRAASQGATFRPSLLMALAHEHPAEGQGLVEERARRLLQHYEDAALDALRPLRQPALKSLLYRVAAMILH